MSSHADSKAQPTPTGNGVSVTLAVIDDMIQRRVHGVAKYGTELKTFNGRDALVDLYQELLDAVNYTKQRLLEEEARAAQVNEDPNPRICRSDLALIEWAIYLAQVQLAQVNHKAPPPLPNERVLRVARELNHDAGETIKVFGMLSQIIGERIDAVDAR